MRFWKIRELQVIIEPAAYCLLAVSILLIPIKFLLAWYLSVLIHEGFHYLALSIMRCNVHTLRIGITGMQMITEPITDRQEILCSAAGPLGGLLVFALCLKHYPILAILSLFHSIYNLIPLYPLDGGRIIHSAVALAFPAEKAACMLAVFDKVFCVLLGAIILYSAWRFRIGILPVVVILVMIFKNKKLKSS